MPSIVASHVYTMVAIAIVSALLIATLNAYTSSLNATAETEQLTNLLTIVASKANEQLTITATTNSSTRILIQLPAAIGTQPYWLRARNDSTHTWIEGSVGPVAEKTEVNKLFLPAGASATGIFIGGHGSAVLESYMNGSTPQLKLAYSGG